MISIICVYNDEDSFNRYLAKSLENQSQDFELIKIDNRGKKFRSAAEALNFGGSNAKGKYLIFVHQDVDLMSDHLIEDVEKVLDQLPDLGIAGVAGCKDDGTVMTNIWHGEPPMPAGSVTVDKPEKVQTVDECLFIIPKQVFEKLRFDEVTCKDWHMYAVDFALSCKKMGLETYVVPMPVYHLSTGRKAYKILGIFNLLMLPREYYRTLAILLKKHKDEYTTISLTCGKWSTSQPMLIQRAGYFLRYLSERLVG